jgi:hypothetical protein
MISTRSVGLVIDTVVCLTLDKWETVSGQFGGYLTAALDGRETLTAKAITLSALSRLSITNIALRDIILTSLVASRTQQNSSVM